MPRAMTIRTNDRMIGTYECRESASVNIREFLFKLGAKSIETRMELRDNDVATFLTLMRPLFDEIEQKFNSNDALVSISAGLSQDDLNRWIVSVTLTQGANTTLGAQAMLHAWWWVSVVLRLAVINGPKKDVAEQLLASDKDSYSQWAETGTRDAMAAIWEWMQAKPEHTRVPSRVIGNSSTDYAGPRSSFMTARRIAG